jgi:hypothetical protein
MNSSESGQAPNNSHGQLANYSGDAYPYAVCCWTDEFRTLTNVCTLSAAEILSLHDESNSHAQVGSATGYLWVEALHYPYSVCLNVTYGTIECEAINDACSPTYNPVVSLASSDIEVENLTNAHLASPDYYATRICCRIGGQTAPVLDHVNITPSPNATTRQDLECLNGPVTDADGDAVTLHYNWYRNGTSITVLNLPMDYDSNLGITHDISGFANHGTVNGAVFKPTGGAVGGAFNFTGSSSITLLNNPELNFGTGDFSITLYVRRDANIIGPQAIIDKKNGTGTNTQGFIVYIESNVLKFRIANGTNTLTVSAEDTLSLGIAETFILVRNTTGIYITQNDPVVQTLGGGTWNLSNNIAPTLGVNSSGADMFLIGGIDELIIYNRSLTTGDAILFSQRSKRSGTELRRTEWWNCSITPIDSTGLNGSTKYSNRTNITGSIPLNATLYYPVNNNQSVFERFVNFSWSAADERDGDAVTYTLNLTVTPGTCSVATAQSNIATTNYTFGELCTDQFYNWTINSCDIDGCSNPSSINNFTIASVVGIQLTTNLTQLGTFSRNQTKATDADNIAPFIVNNTGNVRVNITLNATNEPFTSISMPSTNYQFKAGINTTAAFNTTGSTSTYIPFNSIYQNLIKQLNYTARPNTNTTARIDVNITAPIDEPPGQKQGNFTIKAVIS